MLRSSQHPTPPPARLSGLRIRYALRLLRRAGEVGAPGLLLLAHTFCLLLSAKIALALIPAAKIIAWKQRPLPKSANLPSPADLTRIRHAVLVVARYSPIRFVCFPQCLAAAALLRSYGISSRLHYGVTRSSGKLITHTWLEVQGEILIGGEVAADYATLAVY